MNITVKIHPVAKSPINELISELAEKQFNAVNRKTGNHSVAIPYLGQTVILEMIVYQTRGDYHIEVLNHFFK